MLGPVPAGPLLVLWALAQGSKRAVTPPWPGDKPQPPEPPPTPRRTASGDIVFPPPSSAAPQRRATGLKEPPRPAGVPANARPMPGHPGVYTAPAYATPSGMKQTGPGSYEMPETYITAPAGRPTLRQGMKGEAVKVVQQHLGQKMDGVFGPATKGAVVAFQVQHHLSPDGVVGPATWDALLGAQAPAAGPIQAAPQQAPPSAAAATTLRQGSKGASVQLLQSLLKTAGASSLTVDGSFGPKTTAAVKSFQSAHGLKPDGIAGPATWKALGY